MRKLQIKNQWKMISRNLSHNLATPHRFNGEFILHL